MQKVVNLLTVSLPHYCIDWLAKRSLLQLALIVIVYIGTTYFIPLLAVKIVTAIILSIYLCYLLNLLYVVYQVHRNDK